MRWSEVAMPNDEQLWCRRIMTARPSELSAGRRRSQNPLTDSVQNGADSYKEETVRLDGERWPAIRSSFIVAGAHLRVASAFQRDATVGILRLDHERRMVDQNIASWNQVVPGLRRIDGLRFAL